MLSVPLMAVCVLKMLIQSGFEYKVHFVSVISSRRCNIAESVTGQGTGEDRMGRRGGVFL